MSRPGIMFAVASPGGVDPGTMEKAVQASSALDANLELFYCVFDADVDRPGRFATRGAQEDIHQIVEQRHQQLEYNARRLRARGVRVRRSVRWNSPTYEGIVRQVLRHKPKLLIVQSTRGGRAGRLLITHTDYKLIESCPCPLLLIKTQRPYMSPLATRLQWRRRLDAYSGATVDHRQCPTDPGHECKCRRHDAGSWDPRVTSTGAD